jgi:hypothetical protein
LLAMVIALAIQKKQQIMVQVCLMGVGFGI